MAASGAVLGRDSGEIPHVLSEHGSAADDRRTEDVVVRGASQTNFVDRRPRRSRQHEDRRPLPGGYISSTRTLHRASAAVVSLWCRSMRRLDLVRVRGAGRPERRVDRAARVTDAVSREGSPAPGRLAQRDQLVDPADRRTRSSRPSPPASPVAVPTRRPVGTVAERRLAFIGCSSPRRPELRRAVARRRGMALVSARGSWSPTRTASAQPVASRLTVVSTARLGNRPAIVDTARSRHGSRRWPGPC